MKVDQIERIAVVGAGIMGHAIAQEFARAGYRVSLADISEEKLRLALEAMQGNLGMLAGLGLMSIEQVAPTISRVSTTTDLAQAVSEADVVVEAIPENLALKQRLFMQLDELCPKHTILASNTSTLLTSSLAAVTKRPDKVVVTHYLLPPYLMPVVEVVCGPATAEETIATVVDLLVRQEKKPVVLRKEVPGFIINRLQGALVREACSLVQQGIVSPQEIDSIVTNGLGRRWAAAGPFELMDAQGLDTWVAGASHVCPLLESAPTVPPLLEDTAARGELGAKSGKGFYEWPPGALTALQQRLAETLIKLAQPPRR